MPVPIIKATTDIPARLFGGNAQEVEVVGLDYTLHLDIEKLPKSDAPVLNDGKWTVCWDEALNTYTRVEYSHLSTLVPSPPLLDITGAVVPFVWNEYIYDTSEGDTSTATTMRLLRAKMPPNHPTNNLSVMAIEARPEGGGTNGPVATETGLSVSAIKKNWQHSTALCGEVDGITIVVRNGGPTPTSFATGSDASGLVMNVSQMHGTGYAVGVEGSVSNINADYSINHELGFQIGASEGVIDFYSGMVLNANKGAYNYAYFAQNTVNGSFADFLRFQDASSNTLFNVSGSGKLFVGATTPSTSTTTGALTVAGGVGMAGSLNLSGGGTSIFSFGTDYALYGASSNAIHRANTHVWYNYAASLQVAILNSVGLQVLTATPSTSSTTGAFTVNGGVGIGGTVNAAAGGFARPGATGAMLTTNDTNATATSQVSVLFLRNSGGVGSITTTNAATAYNTSSDGRLKDDLKDFDAGCIIDRTKVYDFRWKRAGERTYGIVAQEAVKVYPQAIFHDEKTDWWGVDYSKYVPLLLAEVKTLRARVAELER